MYKSLLNFATHFVLFPTGLFIIWLIDLMLRSPNAEKVQLAALLAG